MALELISFKLELKFPTKYFNRQINLEIFLLWQSYLEYKLIGAGIPSRYSEYPLVVKISRHRVCKNGIEIDTFGIDKFDVELLK